MAGNITINYKKDRFKTFYFFMMYLFTSMPAVQFNMTGMSNMFFLLLGYGLTVIAAFRYKVNFANRRLFIITLIIIAWSVLQKLVHPSYFRVSPFIALEIFAAYVIINIYKDTIFRRFEDVTYVLSYIALIFWVIDLIAHPLLVILSQTIGLDATAGFRANTLYLYTVYLDGSIRNSAFTWEAGRAACMICVGILFYLMRTNLNFHSRRFWIMTICLLSTMSTTGYCAYIAIILLCYMSMRKINPVVLVVFILSTLAVFSLPFMYDKMSRLTDEASEKGMVRISNSLDWNRENKYDSDRNIYVPQRFEGLMFSFMNLENSNKLIGDGRDFRKFYINREKKWKVKTSEGVLEHSVRYGLVIGLVSFFLLYRASVGISRFYHVRNKWLFFIVFLMINISYNFWEVPLFMSIWMMSIYGCCNGFSIKGNKHIRNSVAFSLS